MLEVWKDIEGFEDAYQVSNFGRIKSLACVRGFNRFGGVKANIKEKILKLSLTGQRYYRVQLVSNEGKKYNFVHRLVAASFIANPFNHRYVNHIDGNKLNNIASNLEWCSSSENAYHKCRVLNKCSGSNHASAKLNDVDVQEIRNLLSQGRTHRTIAIIYNVSSTSITNINTGKSYRNTL